MRRPNVIVVLVDQLRAFELGCYGNPVIRTPHIDRLAAEGVRFELGVTNNPVCTPARSCLLTGQYGRTCTGEIGNVADDPPCPRRRRLPDPTLAEALRAAGYRTALIGKWHIDPSPLTVGFDYAYYPLTIHRYRGQRFLENDRLGPVVEGFAPEHELARVDRYLAEQGGQPFFLFYNISLPHMPIGPTEMPDRYATLYAPEAVPLRGNVFRQGKLAHDEHWFRIYQTWDYFWRMAGAPCWNAAPECGYPDPKTGALPSDTLPAGFNLRNLYALYYGATTWVDDLVGALMASLGRHGLDRDTLVVFTSDHGDNLGSHHLFNKDCLYEESLRIPYILWHPGTLAAQVNAAQVATLVDLMPTVLDWAGIEIPRTVQGQSLAPVARGEREALDLNAAYIETDAFFFGRPTVGIRTPTHLYGAHTAGQGGALAEGWGFYDLRSDALQEHDLLPTREQAAYAAELRAQLRAWHDATPWLTVRG